MNQMETNDLSIRILRTVFGLFIFAFGLYITIHCQIGVSPWDVMVWGISNHTSLSYGTILTLVSLIIIFINFYLHEKIGLGTLLDALLVGNFVDLFTYFNLFHFQFSLFWSIVIFLIGLSIMVFGQYFYMSSGIGCGPRDTLLIGLGKRVSHIPIGYVNLILLFSVLLIGMLLGGPVGIGTFLSTTTVGFMMQFLYKLLKFEPRDVEHESIITTYRNIYQKVFNNKI